MVIFLMASWTVLFFDDAFWTKTFKKWNALGDGDCDLLSIDIIFLGQNGVVINALTVKSKINSFLDSFDFFGVCRLQIDRIINQTKSDAELRFDVIDDGYADNFPFNGKVFFPVKAERVWRLGHLFN